MKYLVYENMLGKCCIIKPRFGFRQSWESESEAIHRLAEKTIPDITEFLSVDEFFIPKDKTFREAWKKGNREEPIKIDLEECKAIHRCRMKMACEKFIFFLDGEIEKAREDENRPREVAYMRTRKKLRTLSEEWDLSHCTTPDEVKYSIPKELYPYWEFYEPTQESDKKSKS